MSVPGFYFCLMLAVELDEINADFYILFQTFLVEYKKNPLTYLYWEWTERMGLNSLVMANSVSSTLGLICLVTCLGSGEELLEACLCRVMGFVAWNSVRPKTAKNMTAHRSVTVDSINITSKSHLTPAAIHFHPLNFTSACGGFSVWPGPHCFLLLRRVHTTISNNLSHLWSDMWLYSPCNSLHCDNWSNYFYDNLPTYENIFKSARNLMWALNYAHSKIPAF